MLAFPVDKVEYAIFRGIEQEGPFKGLDTHFIVGDVPLDTIIENCEAEHIYFGAGGRFDYNPHTVADLIKHLRVQGRKTKVTVESPIVDFALLNFLFWKAPTDFLWHLPIMWHGVAVEAGLESLKHIDREDFGDKVAIKIDTGYSTYSTLLSNFPYSHYNDYSGDKLLIQKEYK